MIQNTVSAVQIVIDDLKRYIRAFKFIFVLFSAGMLIFQIVIKSGSTIVNWCLLGGLAVYYVLDAIFKARKRSNPPRAIKITYAWFKICLNALALASTIYTLYSATSMDKISPISIVLATLSIILFVIKVILEIVTEVVASKFALIKAGFAQDVETSFIGRHFIKNKLPENFVENSTSDKKKISRISKFIEAKKAKKNK